MGRSVVMLALAALLAVPVIAQTFPPPGTGVFTWERVGNRPLNVRGHSFTPDGRLFAIRDTVFTFDPDPTGAPAGRWRGIGRPGGIVDAVLALDPAGDTLLVGDPGYMSRSTNGGATWAVVNGSTSGTVAGGPDKPDGFFVLPPGHARAGRLLAGGVVLFSDNRGATWTEAAQDIPLNSQTYARTFAALPSGRVLAGTSSGVIASTDAGTSYLRTPLWGTFVIESLVPFATPGSSQSGAPSCGLADPALCDGALAVGYSSQLPDARAWRTNDGGRTWSESVALPELFDGAAAALSVGVAVLTPGPDGLGRAITVLGRGVVYATADGGQTWAAIGRLPLQIGGASHYPRLARLGPDGHLWVSTTINGTQREWMYRSAEPATAAFPVAGEPPAETGDARLDVRPNPSSGAVAVRLSVGGPSRSAVVSVYDALGRRVAVLHDGPLAAGAHDLALDAASYAPGVYVVHVRVSPEGGPSWTEVRRVTVAR